MQIDTEAISLPTNSPKSTTSTQSACNGCIRARKFRPSPVTTLTTSSVSCAGRLQTCLKPMKYAQPVFFVNILWPFGRFLDNSTFQCRRKRFRASLAKAVVCFGFSIPQSQQCNPPRRDSQHQCTSADCAKSSDDTLKNSLAGEQRLQLLHISPQASRVNELTGNELF